MRFDIITIFPDMFRALSDFGIPRRAIEQGQLEIACWNPREFTDDPHRMVDDRPYGGGPGMVMMAPPLHKTLQAVRMQQPDMPLVYVSPQGRRLDHAVVTRLAKRDGMILLAGRYAGVDERFIESYVDEEISIGDYVLSGGEFAAMVLIDALVRQLPGVLGNDESAGRDSFASGLLDYPQYTRPEEYDGNAVPTVLTSGDHAVVERWRLKQALGRTWLKRPDLLEGLDEQAKELLNEFQQEYNNAEKSK
ncbi:MAG: tRNA (guanosine(37)-N1)-methyltransferase TrmD [Gammaproteobacteria bacterium]|nr:tRNA (guanosine(37)-N1)-methyltransferase TrmD [Gammaproteobacteria bacterium]